MKLDKNLPTVNDLESLFLNDIRLLDVRAPIEFKDGSLPLAENLPILSDSERSEVGKIYKKNGHEAALKHGLKIINGQNKTKKIDAWEHFFKKNNNGIVYCFRGGLRSQITQQWIKEKTGKLYPRVVGGYKSIRKFLIENLEKNSSNLRPIIIGGRTGVGKTLFLKSISSYINLEELAGHRGSSFGSHPIPQPTQINFENKLSISLLRILNQGNELCAIEDESSNIGKRHIPKPFYKTMSESPIIVLKANLDERINVTLQEYITNSLKEYESLYEEDLAFDIWSKNLMESLSRLKKRLGGDNYQSIKKMMVEAINFHSKNGETDLHKGWIESLLINYYDSMYKYQLNKKKERIIFEGTKLELYSFLNENYKIKKIS